MSSDETQGGRDRQSLLGDEQESHCVNDHWNGRATATHANDGRREQNGNNVVSLADDDRRHSDILSDNGLGQKTNCDSSRNEDDSEQHDSASRKDGSRRQDHVGSSADNKEVQNDLVPENDDGLREERAVCFDDKEQVRQMPLNDYGTAQNVNVSGDVDSIGRNGAVSLNKDRQGQTCLNPLETKDGGHVNTLNGIDSDIAEVTTVSEIDNGSGLHQAVALDDEQRPQDGAVALGNNEIRRIVQEIFPRYPGYDSLLVITDRNASYIRPGVIHIGSLALEQFTLSETVEVWAWPYPNTG